MSVKKILVCQPAPSAGSPYDEIAKKYGVEFTFKTFFKVEPVSVKEFRLQKVNILDYTAIVFTSRSIIDSFFRICEQVRVTIPDDMRYFCTSQAVANYLQKYIVYRKRKIHAGDGSLASVISMIGSKHSSEKFLLATTDNAKPEMVNLFKKSKLEFINVVFSKTVYSDLKDLNLEQYDMLVCFSPQDLNSLKESKPDFSQGKLLISTFGPLTAKAVKAAKLNIEIEAPTAAAPSMSQALAQYLESSAGK
ncbi:MAG: uroporphyrinogen-III synthase [Bacteroidales bacterium]|nr:uroporphyrinogen-III synthase [Bacteroidales bacterium]